MRVVVDTNITVSGLLFGGHPLKVLQLAVERKFTWVTSPPLMEELERVLRYPKFKISSEEIKILLTPIIKISEIVIPTTIINLIERCPADNRVLECALDGQCSYIVTGDRRDLLSIEHFHQIKIVSAKQFLEFI